MLSPFDKPGLVGIEGVSPGVEVVLICAEPVILADSDCSSNSGSILPFHIPDFDLNEKTFGQRQTRVLVFLRGLNSNITSASLPDPSGNILIGVRTPSLTRSVYAYQILLHHATTNGMVNKSGFLSWKCPNLSRASVRSFLCSHP